MKLFFRKKFTALLTVLIMATGFLLPQNASAAPVILGLSSSDIKVGDSFSVSIAGEANSNLSLHYDGTMVTLTGQGGAALNGNTLTIAARSATFTFTAKKEGNAGFVASSDQYERSSAVVKIAAAAPAQTDNKEDSKEATATEKESATSDDSDTSADDTQTAAASSSASDDTDTDIADDTQTSSSDDTVDQKHGISSQDLSFTQLITDRRMIIVLAVLLAVIILLIIRLTTLHYAMSDDYSDDDIDFDKEEKRIAEKEKEEEQRQLVEHVTEKKDKPKKTSEIDLDDIDEEKLTMPKAPKKPNEKLKLEDLNDL